MQILKKQREPVTDDSQPFAYTSKMISDELGLIHEEQENIIQISEELETAFNQVEKIKKLLKIVKKIEGTVLDKEIKEKRKKESKMLNIIEDVRSLVQDQRYEDVVKYLHEVRHYTEEKKRLSQEEMNKLREIMYDLIDLYKEAAGLCRLYRMAYDNVKQVYDKCEQEFKTETIETGELDRAGQYTKRIY